MLEAEEDSMKASEHGGSDTVNGIQPTGIPDDAESPEGGSPLNGHEEMTASERLRLLYTTGQDAEAAERVPGMFVSGHEVPEDVV